MLLSGPPNKSIREEIILREDEFVAARTAGRNALLDGAKTPSIRNNVVSVHDALLQIMVAATKARCVVFEYVLFVDSKKHGTTQSA